MRVLLFTYGSRGDVQPFVALARELARCGHEPVLAANASVAGLARQYDIPFLPLHDEEDWLARDPVVRAAHEINFRGLRGKRLAVSFFRRFRQVMARVIEDMSAAATWGADVVVHLPNLPGHEIAERLGVPAVVACLQPGWVPTASFPNPLIPLHLPGAPNRASYLTSRWWVRGQLGNTSRWRREVLELPRRHGHHNMFRRPDGGPAPVLQAFSEILLPADTAFPSGTHTTGFWFLPAPPAWRPPRPLSRFLATGAAPVYLGFGSVAGTDPARTGRLVADAVRLAGVRALIVTGSGGIAADGRRRGDVFVTRDVPFDWLFPRVAAVVHHGGMGTSSAALAAGRPQVVCPFIYEQPFNAGRLHAAGVAPPPLEPAALEPADLAAAIRRAVGDPAMTAQAVELGRRVRAENGAGRAVRVLETIIAS